jgi:hypothetical protein
MVLGYAVLVAACSAVVVSRLRRPLARHLAAVGMPLFFSILAHCVYWLPVWSGRSSGEEYGGWEFVFIAPAFFAGVVTAGIVAIIIDRRRAVETSGASHTRSGEGTSR